MDYWGISSVYYTYGGPGGEGSWYAMPSGGDVTFTPAPGGADPTIDEVHQWLTSSQPAHISALADQWDNVATLLTSIHEQLYDESSALAKKWTSPAARDQFLFTGPGVALAYLDGWIASAQANAAGLRHIVTIIGQYQKQMEPLWTEYQQKVKDAQSLGFWTKLWDGFGSDSEDADKIKNIQNVQSTYNLKAQNLASSMASDVIDVYSKFSSGHGPIYIAPDAVIDDPNTKLPNMPNMPAMPSTPAPSAPAPPAVPTVGTPPPPTPPPPPPAPTPPPAPGPPSAPPPPSAPGTPDPSQVPDPPVAPPLPVPVPIGVPTPVGNPLSSGPPGLPNAGGTANLPGAPNAPGAPGVGVPRLPNSGVLGRGSITAGGADANGVTRPPTPTLGRPSRKQTPESAGAPHEPGSEDLFGGKAATTPPVIANRRRGRDRRLMPPPAVTTDELSTGLTGGAGSVPPILSRTARGGAPSTRPGTPNRPGIGGGSITPEVAEESTPVLRAPTAGRVAAGKEPAPAALRTPTRAPAKDAPHTAGERRAMQPTRPAASATPGSTAPPTSDEAFGVATPGGGVLAGHADTPTTGGEDTRAIAKPSARTEPGV